MLFRSLCVIRRFSIIEQMRCTKSDLACKTSAFGRPRSLNTLPLLSITTLIKFFASTSNCHVLSLGQLQAELYQVDIGFGGLDAAFRLVLKSVQHVNRIRPSHRVHGSTRLDMYHRRSRPQFQRRPNRGNLLAASLWDAYRQAVLHSKLLR